MTRYAMTCAVLLLAFPAVAQDQPAAAGPTAAEEPLAELIGSTSDPEKFDLARKKVEDCEGEKFVFAWGAGAHPTKVTLCSKKDATPDELVQMLEEAAAKLEQTPSIAEDRRIAIVQQIRARVADIKRTAEAAQAPTRPARVPLETPRSVAVAEAPVTPPQILPSPVVVPPVAPSVAPKPVAVAARPMLAPKPRLSFECITPGEFLGGGPCVTLTRDTVMIVKSGEPIVDGVALRFIRQGDARAEIALGAMRKGQSRRLGIPRQVCSGVVTSEVDVRIVRAGQVVGSEGPYLLRC